MRAHEALSRLARLRAAADAEEGRWLLCALRSAAHVHLGHASFSQYIERIFGYSPRSTQEKLRVAEALEQLPRLARSLETGAVSWCAARELTRVAVAATEQAWLGAAQCKTTREIEALVAGRNLGDEPGAKSSEQPRSRVLRFVVAPETFALFREAMHRLRRAAGGSLDADAALLSMARQVLAGPGEDGRASYQVSLTVCAACGSAGQESGGELVPVGAEIVAMAECDAQHLGQLLPRAANENASARSEPCSPSCSAMTMPRRLPQACSAKHSARFVRRPGSRPPHGSGHLEEAGPRIRRQRGADAPALRIAVRVARGLLVRRCLGTAEHPAPASTGGWQTRTVNASLRSGLRSSTPVVRPTGGMPAFRQDWPLRVKVGEGIPKPRATRLRRRLTNRMM